MGLKINNRKIGRKLMIKISNVSFDTEQYKRSVKNVAIYGAKNNYWCREISVKKRRNTSLA